MTIDEQRAEHTRNVLEINESLQNAVRAAGGSGLSVETLKKMSAIDLLQNLAANRIRFSVLTDNGLKVDLGVDSACKAELVRSYESR